MSAADSTALVGSGQTFAGSQVVIADPDSQVPLADEQIGEVCLAGPSLSTGYFNRDELNGGLFQPLTIDERQQRFLRTGDLGFLSASELFITGRKSELMIVRGKNLHPEDIEEQTCAAHPAIGRGSAIAFSTEIDGKEELIVAAEFERSAPRSESFDPVIAAIRQEINASSGVNPAEILLMRPATRPWTTSGKLRRLSLKASYTDGTVNCTFRERD